MGNGNPPGSDELGFLDAVARSTGRRRFLQWSGMAIAVAAIGCNDDDDGGTGPGDGDGNGDGDGDGNTGVNLGTGDTAILNYAYALEQLEAAFYTQVTASLFTNATTDEQTILNDIKAHEVIHRDFLKAALGTGAIGALEVDFATVDFTSRESVLETAKAFEDLGVAAYNGAGKLLDNPDYLVLAGKIVSVEARHAAAIRDLLNPLSVDFAGDDVVDANGLDVAKNPPEVLNTAAAYVTTEIDASGLPTS